MLKNEMKVKELMDHIDSCFKIYIARKDKTKIGYYSDKWEIPSDIAEMEIFN